MGNFADSVLEKLKNQNSRGGCVKNAIYILISVIIVASVCIFTMCNSMPKTDEEMIKFVELINKEYAPFSLNVTEIDKTNFDSKIKNSAVCDSGSLFVNQNLNLDKFLSTETHLVEDLTLTAVDMAVLFQYSLMPDNVFEVYDANISTQGKTIFWSLLLKLDIKREMNSEDVKWGIPDAVSVKFQARVNKNSETGGYEAMGYDIQINRLDGEDNDFVVKKIKEILNIEEKTLVQYAVYPFTFATKQALIWSTNFSLSVENSFHFA